MTNTSHPPCSLGGKPSARRLPVSALTLLCLCGGFASPAAAQSEVDDLSASLNLGKALQTISVLSQTPGAESAKLNGDEFDVKSSRLHFGHAFVRRSDDGTPLVSPYVEFTLGKGKAEQTVFATSPLGLEQLDLNYRSRSVLLGAGASIPIGSKSRLTPMVLIGRSRLKINGAYTGPYPEEVTAGLEGLLNNGRIRSTTLGAAAQFDHHSMIARDLTLTLSTRYNHFFSVQDKVSRPGLEPRGSSGVGTLTARLETPTKVYVGEREFFAGIFTRGTFLTGRNSDQFGFQRIGELGGTVHLDYPTSSGLGIGFYGSLIRGSGVKGHTLGVSLTFKRFSLFSVK